MDLGGHAHVEEAGNIISKLFPGRFRLVLGDSAITFPALQQSGNVSCDVLRIDGSHLDGAPAIDFHNARRSLSGPRIVWMDDVGCSNWNCHEPTRVWRRAVAVEQVVEKRCHVEDETHGFCVGVLL
mmetsp:Transcript_33763/g.54481  ORF Transcript_33763/g.54481 Transcript_33763/m.54481 type:complete len:126 (+) Transcript_33763:340-717(+)